MGTRKQKKGGLKRSEYFRVEGGVVINCKNRIYSRKPNTSLIRTAQNTAFGPIGQISVNGDL